MLVYRIQRLSSDNRASKAMTQILQTVSMVVSQTIILVNILKNISKF